MFKHDDKTDSLFFQTFFEVFFSDKYDIKKLMANFRDNS